MALYAFDGTWNIRDSKGALETAKPTQYGPDHAARRDTTETNVHRFAEFYGLDRSVYLQGVGTRFGRVGSVLGGASGFGASYRIKRMYRELCTRYFEQNDKDIDIVGFSRGAAMAVHFANLIATHGLFPPNDSKRGLLNWVPSLRLPFRRKPSAPGERPKIRFLGLWDTVGSFGIPLGRLRNRPGRWKISTIPDNVLHSFHAMALDEVRQTFSLVQPQSATVKDPPQHYEVWFRGVHSNLGGGYPDRGLSDIALAWMMEMYLWTIEQEQLRAAAENRPAPQPPEAFISALGTLSPESRGMHHVSGSTVETLEPDPAGELGRPKSLRRDSWRHMPSNALVHHSVFHRPANAVLDHHSANRRLLRRIPRDVIPVYDPPCFYGATPRQEAERVAHEVFKRIPVRQADWLKLGKDFIFRSDSWVAAGQGRAADSNRNIHRDGFISVVSEWLLADRADPACLTISTPLTNYDRKVPLAAADIVPWVVQITLAIEPYVAELREYSRLRGR